MCNSITPSFIGLSPIPCLFNANGYRWDDDLPLLWRPIAGWIGDPERRQKIISVSIERLQVPLAELIVCTNTGRSLEVRSNQRHPEEVEWFRVDHARMGNGDRMQNAECITYGTGEERHCRIGDVLENLTEPEMPLTGNDDRQTSAGHIPSLPPMTRLGWDNSKVTDMLKHASMGIEIQTVRFSGRYRGRTEREKFTGEIFYKKNK